MVQNRLYQLVKNNKPSFIADNQLEHKYSTSQASNYMMCHLPKLFTSLIDDKNNIYLLESHHLSFYQMVDKSNPYLSEYHYTAYLRDTYENLYQLHVYFDQRDQLTTNPLFKLIQQDDENIAQTVSADFSQVLTEFALAHIVSSMSQLRQYQSDQISLSMKEYHASETNLSELSVNIDENLDAYLNQIDAVITKLKKLISLQSDSPYEPVLKQIEKIRNLCLSKKINSEQHQKVENTQTDTINVQAMPPIVSLNLPVHSVKAETVANFDKLRLARKNYNELKNKRAVLREKISAFLKLYNMLNEMTVNVEYGKQRASVSDMAWYQLQLAQELEEGVNLLKDALLYNDYETAQDLIKYASSLPDNLIRIAVSTNNAKLLDFLLSHCVVPINTFIVKDDLTLVQFCLANTVKTSKKEVFDVLIKHKASILQPAKDGLPIAHHILSKIPHELYPSLSAFISAPRFWRYLETSLRYHLMAIPELESEKRAELEIQITLYSRMANLTIGNASKISSLQIENFLKERNKALNRLSEDQQVKLKNDPDFIKATEIFEGLYSEHYKMCSVSEQRQLYQTNVRNLSHINNIGKFFDMKSMGYNELKQLGMDYINNQIKQLELMIELKNIQKIKMFYSIKEQKKSFRKQQEIMLKIRALENINPAGNLDTSTGRMLSKLADLQDKFVELEDMLAADLQKFDESTVASLRPQDESATNDKSNSPTFFDTSTELSDDPKILLSQLAQFLGAASVRHGR